MRGRVLRASFLHRVCCYAGWLALSSAGCSSAPEASPCDAACAAKRDKPEGEARFRVALSGIAKSICVVEAGCPGGPKGTIEMQPLQPNVRHALVEALAAAGFQLVASEADPDMLVDVEWHGTDTLVLKLQGLHGRLIEQATYKRRLERCRELQNLSWEACWAANFEPMKTELAGPLRRSAAVLAAAQGSSSEAAPSGQTRARGGTSDVPVQPGTALPSAVGERLEALQIQETVARYREEMQRRCWQPAFERRAPPTSSSARVSASITVAPSGLVENVTTGGDPPGYPRLSECIAQQVRGWRFPSARDRTVASIPFVFAGE